MSFDMWKKIVNDFRVTYKKDDLIEIKNKNAQAMDALYCALDTYIID